ncbi:MAG: hypothetical protein GX896_00490 [Clostridiales bacterium]|nr:hypothetical protein [Clostridiales bacterium]
MKDKTKNKLKDVSVWVSISLALAIFATIGITIANLVINTERRANSFTVGRVEIDLTEKEWHNVTSDERIVYPGRTVKKDQRLLIWVKMTLMFILRYKFQEKRLGYLIVTKVFPQVNIGIYLHLKLILDGL